jgi:REP element-mobilizing transposase RayT
MARLGRYFLPDQPLHVIQRGNNRGAIFFAVEDYARYHDWLAEAAGRYACRIHAYVLMTNHVHLLVTPQDEDSLPRMMQSLGRRCVRHVNFVYRRSGDVVGGPLPRRADRQRGLFPRLLPLYRAQPGSSADGPAPSRLSLVELSRPCARQCRSSFDPSRTPAQLKSALVTARGLIAYLVQDGVNVRDGDTVGKSQDELIPVRLRKSGRFEGLPVLAASLSA